MDTRIELVHEVGLRERIARIERIRDLGHLERIMRIWVVLDRMRDRYADRIFLNWFTRSERIRD